MTKEHRAGTELRDLRQATPRDREAYFDRWASTYDDDLVARGYRAPWIAADALAQLLCDRDRPILDAGCGTGLVGERLSRRGFTALVGLDVSLDSLAVAQQKACYERLIRGDLDRRLDFDDGAFAAVVCVGTLTYVTDLEALLREFCRLVCADGYVSFTHRTDLYHDGFIALVARLEAEGLWTRISHSDPQPYVPEHDSFAEEIGIHYDVYRVG